MLRLRFALLALLVLTVTACDSTEPVELADDVVLIVGNAGNFSDNNGSLTRYALADSTVTQNLVPTLGGLVQNVYGRGGSAYVLLNFSDSFSSGRGRIDIVDAFTGQTERQIDVRTPRAIADRELTGDGPLSLYVSNLYNGTVTPVNLTTGQAGTPIAVGANPEGVVRVQSRVFVANSGFGAGTTVSVIENDAVVQTLTDVCTGPRTLLADAENEVWVICTGARDFATGAVTSPGEVVVLDGASGVVRQRVTYAGETLGSATFGQDGAIDRDAGVLFVIAEDGVIRFDTRSNATVGRIRVAGAPVGAVAFDADAGRLYLGRPDASNPFTVDGVVTIHTATGTEISRFTAGIAPVSLAFASRGRVIS